jgi:mRNA interferase YafQ
MLHPITTTQFEKDKKKARKQKKGFITLSKIMKKLIEEQPLEPKYCDHPLKGNWKGFRDCHIENDWVLIYRVDKKEQKILFVRLGTHSELF